MIGDGLDVDRGLALYRYFGNLAHVGFGIGNHLINDKGRQTPYIVVKRVRGNVQPVAKLSAGPGKTRCDHEAFLA